MADRLNGYRILILETREEAQFSRLLAEQGADVLQCPMFTIHEAPDPAPIEAWIRRLIANPCDDMVLMTGEGLRRLMKVVRRIGLEQEFVAALGQARKFARGPKPGRALREIGLEPQATTEKPTSEGIAEMLSRTDLGGHRVGLQLYPDKDHSALIGAITAQGAEVDTVLPYVYDAQAAETNIITAIDGPSGIEAVRKHARQSLQILSRSGLKPAPTSSEKSCGCSQAAKGPPLGPRLVATCQTACILTTAKLLCVSGALAGYQTDLRGARAYDRWSGHLAAAPVPRHVAYRSQRSREAVE